jgi:hypothetical protein
MNCSYPQAALPLRIVPNSLLNSVDTSSCAARLRSSHNVLVLPLSSLMLPVTLTARSDDELRNQLRTLLHSPLGIYIANSECADNQAHVWLDVAPEDMPFTLHELIDTLPRATIGAVERANDVLEVH